MSVLDLVGGFTALVGSCLVAIGALGLIRFPDAYARLNAVTKAATLGVVLVMMGVLCLMPSWPAAAALLLASALQLFTSPVGGFALGHAAYRSGTPLASETVYDEYADPDKS
jgi:multicomponent Na+:H+ antiporter subunit G